MPASDRNPRFQVLLNGKPRAIAGLESTGVLTLTVTWVRRGHPASKVTTSDAAEGPDVHLGGLDSKTGEHLEWLGARVGPGDDIRLRVLPPGEFDPAAQRHVLKVGAT